MPRYSVRAPGDGWGIPDGAGGCGETGAWGGCPKAQISDLGPAIEVRLAIPGLKAKSLHVEIAEDLLVVSGLYYETPEPEGRDRLFTFRRLIDLPGPVRDEQCQASVDGDTLFLLLKK